MQQQLNIFNTCYLGDLLSSDGGNTIPMMAIIFALVSSLNSVGVSVYQETLFKVIYSYETFPKMNNISISIFRILEKISLSSSSGYTYTACSWPPLSTLSLLQTHFLLLFLINYPPPPQKFIFSFFLASCSAVLAVLWWLQCSRSWIML